jgi:hypothetical protein
MQRCTPTATHFLAWLRSVCRYRDIEPFLFQLALRRKKSKATIRLCKQQTVESQRHDQHLRPLSHTPLILARVLQTIRTTARALSSTT